MLDLYRKLDKLDRQKHNLMAEIINLPDEVLHHRDSRKEKSVAQMLENLRLTEKNALKSIQRNLELRTNLIESPLCADINLFLMKMALATKIPFLTYPIEAELERRPDFDYLITDWVEIRKSYRETIYSFPSEMSTKIVYKHPVLGLMNMHHVFDFFSANFNVYEKQVLKQVKTVY